MSSGDSVTQWIDQLKAGERDAVQKLWEAYFERLVALARQKLRGAPRWAADKEDVALSAFDSFCRAAERGRFPQLSDRDDLWHLLVVLTARKACDLLRRGLLPRAQPAQPQTHGPLGWHDGRPPRPSECR